MPEIFKQIMSITTECLIRNIETRTTQCLHSLNLGVFRDGASGSVMTSVYFGSGPCALSAGSFVPFGANVGMSLSRGSLSVRDLGTLFPSMTSCPFSGQTREKSTLGVNLMSAGMTSGMMDSALRAWITLLRGSDMFNDLVAVLKCIALRGGCRPLMKSLRVDGAIVVRVLVMSYESNGKTAPLICIKSRRGLIGVESDILLVATASCMTEHGRTSSIYTTYNWIFYALLTFNSHKYLSPPWARSRDLI